MTPAISVLMPVFNGDRHLRWAVESILGQTWRDFEFVVIDDGSTDSSLEILKSYAKADSRLRVTTRPNQGLVRTLTELLGLARAPLVARMDADDIAMPTRLAKQVALMHERPEVVLVGCSYFSIDEHNRLIEVVDKPVDDPTLQQQAESGFTPIAHPCAVFRRDLALQLGGYSIAHEYCEDLDLWLRLGEYGKLASIPEYLMMYRAHGGSISSKFQDLQLARMRQACQAAWQRRGIQGTFGLSSHWRPGPTRRERAAHLVMTGWKSWDKGNWITPLHYAWRAISANPCSASAWKLLACSILKRRPAPVATVPDWVHKLPLAVDSASRGTKAP